MKLVQDLVRKRKLYQILSLVLIALDLLTFLAMEIIDISFTLDNQDYNQKILLFVIKIIVMIVFITFLFVMTIIKFVNTLMISAIAYLVIGLILFCYLLIDQLKSFHSPVDPRPPTYFIYNIESILIVLNVMTGIFRITGGVMILFFITILKIEKKRNQAEMEENLIKMNNDKTMTVNSNSFNNNVILILPEKSQNEMSNSPNSEERDVLDDKLDLGMNYKYSGNKHLASLRKVSLASDSGDYKKFETPRTLTKLSNLDKIDNKFI